MSTARLTSRGFTGISTVILQVALVLPSSVVTVMVAVPFATAVTTPLLLTLATEVLLLDHVTFLFVALSGKIVAVSVVVAPALVSVAEDLLSATPITDIVFDEIFTVTLQAAV